MENIVPGKDVDVVLQADKGAPADVPHAEEAELHHLEEGQVGKGDEQQKRHEQEEREHRLTAFKACEQR